MDEELAVQGLALGELDVRASTGSEGVTAARAADVGVVVATGAGIRAEEEALDVVGVLGSCSVRKARRRGGSSWPEAGGVTRSSVGVAADVAVARWLGRRRCCSCHDAAGVVTAASTRPRARAMSQFTDRVVIAASSEPRSARW